MCKDRADSFVESGEWLISSFLTPGQILQNLCAVLELQLRSETNGIYLIKGFHFLLLKVSVPENVMNL